MIVRVDGDYWDWQSSFVLCLRAVPTLAQLHKRAKVRPLSYGGTIVRKVFCRVVENGVDLKRDYEQYFSREYGVVEEYLDHRWDFAGQDIERIVEEWDRCAAVMYATPGLPFFEEDDGTKLLQTLFTPGGSK